jgi:8-oxo-dGTP pyrophosphatase MutT (NUDIX family)
MKVIGIGVLLQTPSSTFLFQERDNKAALHPGRIAAFGGGIEEGEDIVDCAKRELFEELNISVDSRNLEPLGLFESHHEPGVFIQMFLSKEIDKSVLKLQEGKSIVELSLHEALEHNLVTDFTKEVLWSLKKF